MSNIARNSYEYMLHWWGGCDDAVKKKYGYENYLYFQTSEDREQVINDLREFNHLGLAINKVEGVLSHKDTIACMTFKYNGNEYYYEENFGKEYTEDSARFMFFDGNYSCDCNKSLFIQRECDESFPEMGCGDEIQIADFRIEYR